MNISINKANISIDKAKKIYYDLMRENASLRLTKTSLKTEIASLIAENSSLRLNNTSLIAEIASLKTETLKQNYEKLLKLNNINTNYNLKLPIPSNIDFICKVFNLPVKDAYGGSTLLQCFGCSPNTPIGSCSIIYPVGQFVYQQLSINEFLLVCKAESPNTFYIKFVFTKKQLTQLNSININIIDLYN